MLSQNQEDWDDSIIMNVFNSALRQHRTRTKEDKSKQESVNSSNILPVPDTTGDSTSVITNTSNVSVSGEKRKRDSSLANNKISNNQSNSNSSANSKPSKPSLHQALDMFKQSKLQKTQAAVGSKSDGAQKESVDKKLTPSKKVEFADDVVASAPSSSFLPNASEDVYSTAQQSQEAADYYNYYYNCGSNMPSFPVATSSATTTNPAIPSGMLDEALQNMLMAWYQSGYTTGRYQTLCELSGYGSSTTTKTNEPTTENNTEQR